MKPHKNKIPFPFWGNGITRGTVPRGTVDPIPNGLSLWPRTMFRQVTPSHSHNIYDFLVNFNGNHGHICKRFQSTAVWNMNALDVDLPRSLQVKSNGSLWKSIYDFLFNFNGNHGPICKRFHVTALWNRLDLDFELVNKIPWKFYVLLLRV